MKKLSQFNSLQISFYVSKRSGMGLEVFSDTQRPQITTLRPHETILKRQFSDPKCDFREHFLKKSRKTPENSFLHVTLSSILFFKCGAMTSPHCVKLEGVYLQKLGSGF